ncbi:nucleolar transcription factor 1-B-like isoform X2 [Pseudophryne corroboree]
MKAKLPAKDDKLFKVTVSSLDWDKLAFKEYTGAMCREKWTEISNKIRKVRTLTEMIVDAEECVKNLYEGKNILTHPDFPKKPKKPFFRFSGENKAKYKEIYTDMRHGDLDKILAIIYKELPEETKSKYEEDFLREKQEFDRKLAKFREEHPDLNWSTKKSEKAKASVPDKAMASVPDKAMASVPDKAMASVPDKAKASIPDKAKASVPDKAKASVPDKTKAAVPEKAKTPQQLKSKPARSTKQKTADSAKKRKTVTPSKTTESPRKKRSKTSSL